MAYKAHKIALRANTAQRLWFAQQCGCARFAYNQALSDFKAGLDTDAFRSFIDLNNRFNKRKKEYDWTSAQDQCAALHGVRNLSDAVSRWKQGQNRFPKFKKKGRQSYTVEGYQCKVEGKRIKLPKIGWVKMFSALRFEGVIKRVTPSRTAHRWFVSILVDTGLPNVPRDTRGHPVVGINTLATLDSGKQYPNPRPLIRHERKLKREQRRLSKKTHVSQNWYKQRDKVARIHYRIACICVRTRSIKPQRL